MNDEILSVSEIFFSIQGEGRTAGVPAVFLRLQHCDSNCVWCDTTEVWKKGTKYSFKELYRIFEDSGYLSALGRGAHLVITGGNPVIQQRGLINFFEFIRERYQVSANEWFIEVETQATLETEPSFEAYVSQWNVSPKLQNSCIDFSRRIYPMILRRFVELQQSKYTEKGTSPNWPIHAQFKFPIYAKEEVSQIEQIAEMGNIPSNLIWLMPICGSRQEHIERAPAIAEICKQEGYNFSPRLQLLLWDKCVGV